jgi:hypothetical protein
MGDSLDYARGGSLNDEIPGDGTEREVQIKCITGFRSFRRGSDSPDN